MRQVLEPHLSEIGGEVPIPFWSAALCAVRRAPHEGQMPRRLQEKATSLSWPHPAEPQPQEPVGKDAAFEERVELVFDELGQARGTACLDLGEERFEILLHRAEKG